jgi:glycine/D-amino acid oxidase-like deaminating enzyme
MSQGRRTADIAIVGAGIIGMACAYELSLRRAGKIVVFDKNVPGSGTTSGSGGVICTHDLSRTFAQMSLLGYERVKQLRDDHGLHFSQWGRLELSREPGGPSTEQSWYEETFGGLPEDIYEHELMSVDDLEQRFPWLSVPGVTGAAYHPNQGYVDTYELLSLYQRLAVDTGSVEVLPNTPVLDIRRASGRVTSVVTRRGQWHVGAVVNAAGPWGKKAAQLAGVDVPLEPQRVQVCIATAFDDGRDPLPHISGTDIHIDGERIWLRGEAGGTVLLAEHHDATTAGSPVDPDKVARSTDEDFAKNVDRVAREALGLEKAVFLNGWTCVYGTTVDGHPLIGADPSLDGLYHVIGCNGHGMTCHAGYAIAATSAVLDGGAPVDLHSRIGRQETLDVPALGVDRFDRNRALSIELIA